MGSLKWNIQEELSLWTPTSIQRYQKLSLKVEARNKKKGDSKFNDRDKGINKRGERGSYQGRGNEQRNQGENKLIEKSIESTPRGGYGKVRGNQGGFNRGKGLRRSNSYFSSMKFYNYGELNHPTYRCPKKPSSSSHDKRVAYAQEDNCKENEVDQIKS